MNVIEFNSRMDRIIRKVIYYAVLLSAVSLLLTIVYYVTVGGQPIEKWLEEIALVFSSIGVSIALVTLLFSRANWQDDIEETSEPVRESTRQTRLAKSQLELMNDHVKLSRQQIELLRKQFGLAEQQFDLLQQLFGWVSRRDESSEK